MNLLKQKLFFKKVVFLQEIICMYDHLTEVLNQILAERPENVIDFFEEYSRKVKEKRFQPMTDHLEDIYVSPLRYCLARKILPFLRPAPPDEASTVDPEDVETADMSTNDMLQLLYYFEQCGVGLPREEMFAIMLSMRVLAKKAQLAAIRFWGKIYGTYKNYIILETELKEEEIMKKIEAIESEKEAEEQRIMDEKEALEAQQKLDDLANQEVGGEDVPVSKIPRQLPPAPLNLFEEVPECPPELPGTGVNKKTYFVCNEVGDEWIPLPDLIPIQIRVARLICKSFTGNLEQEIITYPEFQGTEKDLLRAQIARISAGSQISPLGFYTFGEGGGGEEEEAEAEEAPTGGEQKTTYNENKRYEPPPIRDLTDGSMSFWVHHTLYILPQGRTSWWNPYPSSGGAGGEEEGEGGEEEEPEKPQGPHLEPETGPPLLTPLSEDASVEAVPPWSVRVSSSLLQDYAIAIVRSNIWPGAYCFSTQGKLFQNVYLGNGLKYIAYNFSPRPLPPVEQEYPLGPEIMEMMDPTGAEEEAWRIAHLPVEKPVKVMGEGEEGEEEQPEEEEEEDDE
ncbi:radial spoke head protein 6 homolog A isoform X2 [Onthophagus taurus]|uniref:radial spoke head protein 6 homolog A isoform X2 n=1 Tax=Onthophagus taurus TaxID=166361 RepID=UPI000C201B80|nr:radial spoke head protein 6 homolog A isoform X2 [Onthophagus taurus]